MSLLPPFSIVLSEVLICQWEKPLPSEAKLVAGGYYTHTHIYIYTVPSESIDTPLLIPHFVVLQPELNIHLNNSHLSTHNIP